MRRFLERLFPTLRAKIAVAVALVLLGCASIFLYFAQRTGYELLQQLAIVRARANADFVRGVLEHSMLYTERPHIQHAMDEVLVKPYIVNVYLIDSSGEITRQAKHSDNVKFLPINRFKMIPETKEERFLILKENDSSSVYILTPVLKMEACNRCHQPSGPPGGFIGVKLSLDDISTLAQQHRIINIAVTVITFIGIGSTIFLTLLFLVIKPVTKLHHHIRTVKGKIHQFEQDSKTSFPLLEEPTTNDEIAGLTRDFNELVKTINEAHARIHELHQKHLEHADRLATTGEMAAGIAHEIKNPIAGIMGALQVFNDETPEDHPRKEVLSEMIIQIERINHVVNDFLSYARPINPLFTDVNLHDLVQKTLTLISQQTKGKKITITNMLNGNDPMISADPKQLQQVLWNVMVNAIQAMDGSGQLTIASSQEDSVLKLLVMDTGRGIPADVLDRIFQPFFTTKHKGTGLGMTISRRIIEQHRGSISVSSQEGSGTTVTITLPRGQFYKG